MLGRAVVEAVLAAGAEPIALTRAQLDVTDERAVHDLFGGERPQAVVNCAAFTDVDGAQSDAAVAYAVNGEGTGNVARAAAAVGARLVHVSSDYVFDGLAARPYVESDPTGPSSVYGESKLAGEQAVLAAGGDSVIVRTAWLFGAGGRNFVDTMLALADGGRDEVTVVTDQLGCPTWTGHLAPALAALAGAGPAGIVHVASSGSASWNELAREVFEVAGRDVTVLACSTLQMPRPAPRPAFSVLESQRPDAPRLPHWSEGVRAYLGLRAQSSPPQARSAGGVL